jgi:hypothetical protein
MTIGAAAFTLYNQFFPDIVRPTYDDDVWVSLYGPRQFIVQVFTMQTLLLCMRTWMVGGKWKSIGIGGGILNLFIPSFTEQKRKAFVCLVTLYTYYQIIYAVNLTIFTFTIYISFYR